MYLLRKDKRLRSGFLCVWELPTLQLFLHSFVNLKVATDSSILGFSQGGLDADPKQTSSRHGTKLGAHDVCPSPISLFSHFSDHTFLHSLSPTSHLSNLSNPNPKPNRDVLE